MSNYVIANDVNGSINIQPGNVDTTSTSLALVGRNVTNYGQFFAQNTFSQLCNFAGPVQPTKPLIGQLWYNSSSGLLNYLTSNTGNNDVWQQVASESWVNGTFATIAELNTLSSKEASDIANLESYVNSTFVSQAELTNPPSNATPIPIAAGGTGIKTLGSNGQVFQVNSSGGISFVTPSTEWVTSFNGNIGTTTYAVTSLTVSPGSKSLVSNSTSTGVSISPIGAGSNISLSTDANNNVIINSTFAYTVNSLTLSSGAKSLVASTNTNTATLAPIVGGANVSLSTDSNSNIVINSSVPAATTSAIGGVKVGTGLAINSGVLSVAGVSSNSLNPLTNGVVSYRTNADGTIEFWGMTNLAAGVNSVLVTLPVAVSYYIGWSAADTGGSCFSAGIGTTDNQHITIYGPPYWFNGSGSPTPRAEFGCAWHVIAKA